MSQYQLSLDQVTPDDACRASPANPFLDARVTTFADMIDRIRQDQGLRQQRRHELVSALRRFAQLTDQDPAAMPALLITYKRELQRLIPVECALSPKSIANIKSNVIYCLRRYGTLGRRTAMPSISDAWHPLWQRLTRAQRWPLNSLVRWCSGSGRLPRCITNCEIAEFHADLSKSVKGNVNRQTQRTCRTWNKLRLSNPDLGLQPLVIPRYYTPICLPLGAFTEDFQRDVREYLDVLSGADPFAENGPSRPLRPKTVELRCYHLRKLATGLVRAGIPVADINSLATLVQQDNLTKSLRFLLDSAGGKSSTTIFGLAKAAKTVAKYWVHVDQATLARIGQIASKVRVQQFGMSEKNTARLRQFNHPAKLERLLFFAEDCLAELRQTDDGSQQAARWALVAIAVELLICAAIRVSNLASLRLDVHILRSRTAEQKTWHLDIPAEETKNRKAIQCVLPPRLVSMLNEYLRRYRPRLAMPGNDHLFCSGTGPIRAATLSHMLSRKVHARTGLRFNPHLVRHFSGKEILEEEPGNYGLVQRVLNHGDVRITQQFYTGSETAAALRHFDGLISNIRARLRPGTRKC
jgi:integrase